MIKVVKASEAIERKVADTYSVFVMFSKGDSKNLSICLSKAENHREITLNTKSDRVYYITKGRVNIKAEGKRFEASKGDLIFISANTNMNSVERSRQFKSFLRHLIRQTNH